MDNGNNTQVIYVRDLLFAALYQWKKCLLAAVILAVVLGGFKGVSTYKSNHSQSAVSSESSYQEMDSYTAKKEALEQKLSVAQENVLQHNYYLNESVLMNLDPYHFYGVYLSAYVNLEPRADISAQGTDSGEALLNAYAARLTGEACINALAQKMDTQGQYVAELISIEILPQTLTVYAKAPDEATGQLMADFFREQLPLFQKDIAASLGLHQIHVTESYTRKTTDAELAALQKEQSTVSTTLAKAVTSAQQQLNKLAAPGTWTAADGNAVKDALTFAIVGGILGIALVILVTWIGHIFNGRIYSAQILKNRTGIKVVGCVSSKPVKNPIDRWLRRKEGRCVDALENRYRLLAADLSNRCAGSSHLLVTGETAACPQLIQALEEALPGVKTEVCGSLLHSVDAVKALACCENVVVIAQCRVSSYAEVTKVQEMILDYRKPFAGCVLLDG